MSRINAVLTSSAFECIFQTAEPPLTAAIADFVANNNRLLRICLSGVAYEFKAREIVANVMGRQLLNMALAVIFKPSLWLSSSMKRTIFSADK